MNYSVAQAHTNKQNQTTNISEKNKEIHTTHTPTNHTKRHSQKNKQTQTKTNTHTHTTRTKTRNKNNRKKKLGAVETARARCELNIRKL